jgi:DUF2934 family protein
MQSNLQNRIRERAYEIWDAGGRGNGYAEQHWLAAEREILAQMIVETPPSQPIKAAKIVRQKRPLTNIQRPEKKAAKAN